MDAIRTQARQIRKLQFQLIEKLKACQGRISAQELGELCEQIAPGHQHLTGGLLFEHWFYENGKKSLYDWACEEEVQNENMIWSPQLCKQLLKVEVPRWAYSVLCNLNSISQKNTEQLFYVSLLCEWKGMSWTGLDILGKMGGALLSKQHHTMKHSLAITE
jgi:hypothetical protein